MNEKYNNLKKIRKERGLTAKEVVEGAGIPMRTYQNYEYMEREIGAGALQKLADFYGVSTDYLLGRESPGSEITKLVEKANVKYLEEILIREYLTLPNRQREAVLDFLRNAIRQEADRQGITLSRRELVEESARAGNGTQTKSYPVEEGEKADAAPLVNPNL